MSERPPASHLRIGVRELVSHALRAGDLNLERLGSAFTSPVDAIRAHQKLQAARGDGYDPEVAVAYTVDGDGLGLLITGRIDGVLTLPSGDVIVEEIKTTRGDIDALAEREEPTHWGQLEVYAFIYAEARNLETVTGRLTYYHLDTETVREVERSLSLAELRSRFDAIVGRYLRWAQRIAAWTLDRDRSVEAVEFPFDTYRPGQRSMAVSVYRTIEEGDQLVVQAPTGIGKTQAALFPAIKAVGKGLAEKIFYLTARTTGRGIAEGALDELHQRGLRLKSVTLTAKEKICFNPDKACNGEDCEFARGFYDRLDQALAELFDHDAFTRERVEEVARRHRVCPFELSLELARWAEVIIGDYNYVFDPRTHLRRFFDEGKRPFTFLVDEAHNLPDRARDMYSAELCKKDVLRVRRSVDKVLQPGLWKTLGALQRAFLSARPRFEEGGADPEPPTWLTPALRKWVGEVEGYLDRGPVPDAAHALVVELFFTASRFLRVAERFDERYVTVYDASRKDLRVRLFCTDPSEDVAQSFAKARASILFSATLTPFHFYQTTLGLDDELHRLALPSPFPKENLLVLVGERIATTFRRRDDTRAELTDWLRAFVSHKPGNYLIFFPSYAYLSSVREEFESEGEADTAGMEVLVQRPDMAEDERLDFLARFDVNPERPLVGFAVMGGFFGEGIDLVGERLDGVAIVGVGLPGLSPERDHMRDHFERTNGAGFDYAYAYPGMNRVLQAAGRLIRSDSDRGTVLLIDERFRQARYRRQLPPDWEPRYLEGVSDLEEALADFWAVETTM